MSAVLDITNAAIAPPSSPSSSLNQSLAESEARTTETTASRGRPPNQPRQQVIDAGPSLQRVAKVYASTAEAIANFKPTPREVISGIAPHVFDERKRRRSQKRASKPYWYEHSGQKRPSPLRGATVISWDEHCSIYLEQVEQPDLKPVLSSERSESSPTSLPLPPGPDAETRDTDKSENTQRVIINKRRVKLDKSGWKHFRVDIHLFKSIGVKLKLTTASAPSTKP